MKSPDLDSHLASSYELGWTSNPITGCLNGCPYCYARKLANGRLKWRYLANTNVAPRKLMTHDVNGQHYEWLDGSPDIDPFYPRFWMDRVVRLDQILSASRKPLGIFPCDMSDWCGIGIPESWSNWVLEMARRYSQHRLYLLTKQPQNLPNFSPFPPNCWVGVTATNADMFQTATAYLEGIEASVKYASIEPLLDWDMGPNCMAGYLEERGIGWLIIGSQTKPYLAPKIGRVVEIVEAADKAGVPVFLKDNLNPILETLNITGGSFGRLTSLTAEAIKDTQGLPRQRGWYELRQETPG